MSKKKRAANPPIQGNSTDAPYGGNDYRVRVIEVTMIVDVYNSDGELLGRVKTNEPFAIPECDFSPDMCRLIQTRTDLKNGFYCLKLEEKKGTATP